MAAHLTEMKLNDTQEERDLGSGRIEITARIPDTLQFEQWLMSFGANVEVLEPKKLRDKFKSLSKKMGEMYL